VESEIIATFGVDSEWSMGLV